MLNNTLNTIKTIPNIVIDLFVVDNTYKYIDYNSCTILKNNNKNLHTAVKQSAII